MSRPFFKKSIYELETALSENSADQAFLEVLHSELLRRSTERARKLRVRVEALIANKPKRVLAFSSQGVCMGF